MIYRPHKFSWSRPIEKGGLKWIGDPSLGYGLECILSFGNTQFERYFPIKDHPCLFRVFAETDPTPDGLLEFASSYGPLLRGSREYYCWWSRKHFLVRCATRLMDAIAINAEEQVQVVLSKMRDRPVPPVSPEYEKKRRELSGESDKEFADRMLKGRDEFSPDSKVRHSKGYGWLDFVRDHLLHWLNMGHAFGLACLEGDFKTGFRIVTTPNSLIDVMWWQFAMALCEGKSQHRCEGCGEWLDVGGGTVQGNDRIDKRTCGDACRARVYKKRKARAQAMRAEGKTVRQIAKALGADVGSVKRWVEKSKKPKGGKS